MRVGFVGIGRMGWPMAARLVAAGHDVAAYDAAEGRAMSFALASGARPAASAGDAAHEAEVVITMLPDSKVVEAALTALLPSLAPGALVVEMSSASPSHTVRLADVVAEAGGSLIDAPVSGGVSRAETGELSIMVGGADADIARAEPLLRAMGTTITRTGGVGSAHAMKALNNLVSAGGFLIGIEALLIGKRFGLDPALMVDVLNASTGMSNSSQKKFKQFVLSRRFDSGFGLDLMVKDVSIALDLGKETKTATPFSALLRDLSAAAQAMLGPGHDHTEFAKLAETFAGDELGPPSTD